MLLYPTASVLFCYEFFPSFCIFFLFLHFKHNFNAKLDTIVTTATDPSFKSVNVHVWPNMLKFNHSNKARTGRKISFIINLENTNTIKCKTTVQRTWLNSFKMKWKSQREREREREREKCDFQEKALIKILGLMFSVCFKFVNMISYNYTIYSFQFSLCSKPVGREIDPTLVLLWMIKYLGHIAIAVVVVPTEKRKAYYKGEKSLIG